MPTSVELSALHLRPGRNMITYTFVTKMWGRQEVQTCAYLWEWNAKVVISDVDGTITKSDMLVRGSTLPCVTEHLTRQRGLFARFASRWNSDLRVEPTGPSVFNDPDTVADKDDPRRGGRGGLRCCSPSSAKLLLILARLRASSHGRRGSWAQGHILPMVGRDWSHSGITSLFRNIRANGYKFMFLTSRAIAQADATRDYLTNLSQVGSSLLSMRERVVRTPCGRFAVPSQPLRASLFGGSWP